jgi:hypothetical protein
LKAQFLLLLRASGGAALQSRSAFSVAPYTTIAGKIAGISMRNPIAAWLCAALRQQLRSLLNRARNSAGVDHWV